MNARPLLSGLGGIGLFLGLWQLITASGLIEYDFLPSPWAILGGLWAMLGDREFYDEALHTLAATLGGWVIAVVLGVGLGALLGSSATCRRYSLATVEVLRPLPAVAFVPLALLLFGFSLQMELLVIVAPALWPSLINTMEGFAGVPQRLSDVAASFRLSPIERLLRIDLPADAPSVLVGLRLSLSLALVMSVVAEMVGNPQGLGYGLVREQQALNPERMFGYVIVIGLVGVCLNAVLVMASGWILPGQFRRPQAGWDTP